MKFVINTNYNAAGALVLEGVVKRLQAVHNHSVTRNDWNNYEIYDIAIFMAPDSAVITAKKANPKLVCGIFDPKVTLRRQRKEVKAADFLIVSSIEQRDFFLKYNKNIFIYYMFPDVSRYEKKHGSKEKIVIGYHGNKQHLDAMKDLSWALDQLSQKYPIEFHAIYNIKKLGKWVNYRPRKCHVRDIQWAAETFMDDLSKCDIGVVPSLLPAPSLLARPLSTFIVNREGYHTNDYVARYKLTNNPGRLYVFAQAGLPVIADFTPSSGQFIRHGENGLLAGTKHGWQACLEELVLDAKERQQFADCMRDTIEKKYTIDANFVQLMQYLESLSHE